MTNAQFPELMLRTTISYIAEPLPSPTGVTAIAKDTMTITVSWNDVTNASGYIIQCATNSNFTSNVRTLNIDKREVTTADIIGLNAGTTYYIRILATGIGTFCNSDYSNDEVSASTHKIELSAPKGITATIKDATTITVEWNYVSGASGYIIEYASDQYFTQIVGTYHVTNSNTYPYTLPTTADITELDTNILYFFHVKALGSGVYADSEYSSVTSDLTQAVRLNDPMLTSVIASADKISATWDKVPGASEYLLEYSTDNWATTESVTVSGDQSTATIPNNALTGTQYQFRIKAKGLAGEFTDSEDSSESSVIIPVATPIPAKPKKVKSDTKKATITSIELTWTAMENVEYVITCASLPGWSKTVSGGKAVIDESLEPGKSYKFTITAKNADGIATDDKGKSTAMTITAKTPKYTAVKVKADTKGTIVTGGDALGKTKTTIDSVTLTWATAGRPEGEQLVVKVINAKTKQEVTANLEYSTGTDKVGKELTTLTITGLKAGTKYTVEMQAYAGGKTFDDATYKATKVTRVTVSTAKYPAVKFKVTGTALDSITLEGSLPKAASQAIYAGAYTDFVVLVNGVEFEVHNTATETGKVKLVFDGNGILTAGTKYTLTIKAAVKNELENVLNFSLGSNVKVTIG
jgi:hypothetical protein